MTDDERKEKLQNTTTGYEFKTFKGFLIHLGFIIGIFCALSLNSFENNWVGMLFYALFFGLVAFVATFNYLIIKGKHLKWYWYLCIFLGTTAVMYGLLIATGMVNYVIWGLINNIAVALTSLGWIGYKSYLIFTHKEETTESLKFIIAAEIAALCFGFFGVTIQQMDDNNTLDPNKTNAIKIYQKLENNINLNAIEASDKLKEIRYIGYDNEANTLDVAFINTNNENRYYSYVFDGSDATFNVAQENMEDALNSIIEKDDLPAISMGTIGAVTDSNFALPIPTDYESIEAYTRIQYKNNETYHVHAGVMRLINTNETRYASYKIIDNTSTYLELDVLSGVSAYLIEEVFAHQVEA